jgi:uncharacterized membrane-anchored protein
MNDHELRLILNDELHGRPGVPVKAPARITHLAYTISESDEDPQRHVERMCDALGLKPPAEGAPLHWVQIDGGLLKYERHAEFYRISVVSDAKGNKAEAIAILPLGWIEGLPGKRLVAIHTQILEKSAKMPDAAFLTRVFGHEDLAASLVSHGTVVVWTDFKIGGDGYTRILVKDHGSTPLQLGRTTRRIHEIETYRMMALLALPLAKQLQKELGPLELSMSETIDGMLAAKGSVEDAKLLSRLSKIARDVEEMSNRSSFRFAAARAYSALVTKRVAELGEERVMNYQRLGVFLDRRFSPAMTTCQAVADRIENLARRCERASNLLRTRVDIALEGQSQLLLHSMEIRGRQQLMLQETVEGLSVVAISYYLIGIVGKLLDGASAYVPGIDSKLAGLASIPMIVLLVWYGIRRLRWKVQRAALEQGELAAPPASPPSPAASQAPQ